MNDYKIDYLFSRVLDFGKLYTFDISFNSMYVTGTYEIDGQILVLPIKGSGKFSANFCKL